ncbi:MAG: helix-turn-helix transcriptional regulator [Anaerolineae bacterium]|nr:helix-turn-helix transcriptional regulator [Anaerolineae bacterium]
MNNSWLRLRREELNMNQDELLEKLSTALGRDLNRATISHWETNKRRISLLHSPEG